MSRPFKIGGCRFPAEEQDAWCVDITMQDHPTVVVTYLNGVILAIHNRNGGFVQQKAKDRIVEYEDLILREAQGRPFNAYRVATGAKPLPIYFETRPTETGFDGRIIGLSTIANPSLRVRAGIHYVTGAPRSPGSFVMEDPVSEIILVPMHTPQTKEQWETAAIDSISDQKRNEVALTDWVEMDFIESRDEYVLHKMREVLKRVVQG
jgi:hypothetical protein